MASDVGIQSSYRAADFDDAYVAQLEHWFRKSSLGAAVLLGCDAVHLPSGEPRPDLTPLYVPNDYVFQVCARVPGFLPGVSIHPGRRDALEELDRCAERGAALLKLLPCVQIIDPNDRRYEPFWQRMAELHLPLLAHTGGEFTLPNHRPDLQTPVCLRLPLECGVNVIAAHCGARALPWDQDYFTTFCEMRERYANLFGDLSALSQPTHFRTLAGLRQAPQRILHGTDYPVVTAVWWSRIRGWLDARAARELRAEPNPLERKIRLTRALGFPERVFQDAWQILRAPPRQ